MKKIAVVPYAPGKAYEFYDDRIVIDDEIIAYSDIQGYSYLLSHNKTSINLVPIANSARFTVYFDVVGEKKPYDFGRYSSAPMYFKTEKHKTVDLIFTEVVRCIEALIAPNVFKNLVLSVTAENQTLMIGSLVIGKTGISKKSRFGQKKLQPTEIGWAGIQQGLAIIKDARGKTFFSCSLATMNSPLIPRILDAVYGAA